MALKRPPLQFEELIFPEKVLCQLADCPSLHDPLGRRSQATVQDVYTKICICYRCHVRIIGSQRMGSGGEILIGRRAPRVKTSETLKMEGCRLLGSDACPCGNEAECPLYRAPENLEAT